MWAEMGVVGLVGVFGDVALVLLFFDSGALVVVLVVIYFS